MIASLPNFCVECTLPPALMKTSRYWNQESSQTIILAILMMPSMYMLAIAHVDDQNKLKLKELAPEQQHVVIKAIDNTKDKHTQLLNLKSSDNKADTGGLVSELHLAVGAKVILTVNVDVSDGLVNGAREDIIKTGTEVTLVLVKFDHSRVDVTAIARSQYRSQYPEAVPISRHEAVFFIGKNKLSC